LAIANIFAIALDLHYLCRKDIAMKAHVTIDLSNPGASALLGYLDTLPFAEVKREKKSFEQACKECNAVTVDEFFDELNRRVDKWPDKNA
jgi:hypothetical protein